MTSEAEPNSRNQDVPLTRTCLGGRGTSWVSSGVRYARAALIGVGGAYAILAGVLFAGQERMIFPGHESQGTPEARLKTPPDAKLLSLKAGGDRIAALYGPALTGEGVAHPNAARCPTLLYFYGNGSQLATSRGSFAYLRRLGVNVLIPEYPGYGLSEGEPGEVGCYRAADAAYEYLTRQRHLPAQQLIVAGGSLGGAVAIDLAARKPVAALAAFNTFTSMPDMASQLFPWAPSQPLLRHRFESERKIHEVHAPIFLAAGEADSFIPPAMTGRLAAGAGGPVTQILVRGAGHNSLPTDGTPEFRQALQKFVRQVAVSMGREAESQQQQ